MGMWNMIIILITYYLTIRKPQDGAAMIVRLVMTLQHFYNFEEVVRDILVQETPVPVEGFVMFLDWTWNKNLLRI